VSRTVVGKYESVEICRRYDSDEANEDQRSVGFTLCARLRLGGESNTGTAGVCSMVLNDQAAE